MFFGLQEIGSLKDWTHGLHQGEKKTKEEKKIAVYSQQK